MASSIIFYHFFIWANNNWNYIEIRIIWDYICILFLLYNIYN
jgi:hypothetical protein